MSVKETGIETKQASAGPRRTCTLVRVLEAGLRASPLGCPFPAGVSGGTLSPWMMARFPLTDNTHSAHVPVPGEPMLLDLSRKRPRRVPVPGATLGGEGLRG